MSKANLVRCGLVDCDGSGFQDVLVEVGSGDVCYKSYLDGGYNYIGNIHIKDPIELKDREATIKHINDGVYGENVIGIIQEASGTYALYGNETACIHSYTALAEDIGERFDVSYDEECDLDIDSDSEYL